MQTYHSLKVSVGVLHQLRERVPQAEGRPPQTCFRLLAKHRTRFPRVVLRCPKLFHSMFSIWTKSPGHTPSMIVPLMNFLFSCLKRSPTKPNEAQRSSTLNLLQTLHVGKAWKLKDEGEKVEGGCGETPSLCVVIWLDCARAAPLADCVDRSLERGSRCMHQPWRDASCKCNIL